MTDLLEDKYNFMIDLYSDDKFETVSDVDDIVTSRKLLEGSDIACFRACGYVNAKPEELVDYVWKIYSSEEAMKKWDSDVATFKVTDVDADVRICYQVNSLPWPMWSRDFVFLQQKIMDIDRCCLMMYSVESTDFPRLDNQFVRANINISAFIFEPNGEGCDVYRIAHIDPCGSIPVTIVNSYASKAAKAISNLKAVFNA